ncbi:MAG: DoxX family protein [Marmoricola sp.]|jgi:thiosulfate dehydrogenase [quinone] large subunit|nr:DoxX family protein [Marmoricola sp.]
MPTFAVSRVPATWGADIVRSHPARMTLGGLRIVVGWYFLWAFIDKLVGLGYATAAGKGMIDGGTPAQGFMSHADGPFAGFFSSISGRWADYGFMFGLLAIGVALITGCGLKITAVTATVLLALMYLAEFPIGAKSGTYTNPLVDDHWVEALAVISFWFTRAGDTFGMGRWWGEKVGDGWLR